MSQYAIRNNICLLNNRNGTLQGSLLFRNKAATKKLYSIIQPKGLRFMHHNAKKNNTLHTTYYFNNTNLNQSIISKRLIHFPHLPQFPKKIPNKYELLIQARGFLQRLKVRIKYPLMKQMRPFTLNDITALFSWVFLGHTVWLLVGTTSFLSLGLWAANSLQFQGS